MLQSCVWSFTSARPVTFLPSLSSCLKRHLPELGKDCHYRLNLPIECFCSHVAFVVTMVMIEITWWLQWNLDNSNCRDNQKSLSYEKLELRVMLSLCFSHVATGASLLCSSVLHFLAKFSIICEIFISCEKKTLKLSFLYRNVNSSSHKKR